MPRSRLLLALTVACLTLAACGDDEEQERPAASTVCDVLREPPGDDVVIAGTGQNLFRVDHGFALTEGGCSIFVTAPRNQVAAVKDGDPIEVRGRAATIDSVEARRLEFARSRRPPSESSLDAEVPGELPTNEGEIFFDAYSFVRGAGE